MAAFFRKNNNRMCIWKAERAVWGPQERNGYKNARSSMSFMHSLSSTTFVSSGMRRLQMKLSTTQCTKTMKYSLLSQGTGIL